VARQLERPTVQGFGAVGGRHPSLPEAGFTHYGGSQRVPTTPVHVEGAVMMKESTGEVRES